MKPDHLRPIWIVIRLRCGTHSLLCLLNYARILLFGRLKQRQSRRGAAVYLCQFLKWRYHHWLPLFCGIMYIYRVALNWLELLSQMECSEEYATMICVGCFYCKIGVTYAIHVRNHHFIRTRKPIAYAWRMEKQSRTRWTRNVKWKHIQWLKVRLAVGHA